MFESTENEFSFLRSLSRMASAFEEIAKEKKRSNDLADKEMEQISTFSEMIERGFAKLDKRLTANEQQVQNIVQWAITNDSRRTYPPNDEADKQKVAMEEAQRAQD